MRRDRVLQLAFLLAAAAALAGAALLRGPLQDRREELAPPTVISRRAIAASPHAAVLQLAPGGLRVIALNYLWIRSQQLKEQGRLFDAKQLRELICDLMPFHEGAWNFLSWDMAWNISVATHTPEERWMWVYSGITLLRDRGLIYNPNSLLLHKQIAYTFVSKMGDYTDEMHMVYKRRWAEEMDRLLGSPPLTGTTEDVIEAFRPVAEAPRDLQDLLGEAGVAEFMSRLGALGVAADGRFLQLYNLYSTDPLRGQLLPPEETPAGKSKEQIAELMSSPEFAAARARVLAFARRKVLTEQFRMDPEWMLKLMVRYGPLDWRSVYPHGIYWAALGLYRSMGLELKDIHAGSAEASLRDPAAEELRLSQFHRLNTERYVLWALKALTRTGQVYYVYRPNPEKPAEPIIEVDWAPDWRFIEPTHQEYAFGGASLVGRQRRLDAETNTLRDGHVNYLSDAVQQLYIGGREQLARRYYDEMKRLLKPEGPVYELDLPDFVREKIRTSPAPTADVARAFWYGALVRVYKALAAGDQAEYLRAHRFAQRVYKVFAEGLGEAPRLRPPPFQTQERNFLVTLLLRPRAVGLQLPLEIKSMIYRSVSPGLQAGVYPFVAKSLQAECRREKLDFEKAFPPPAEVRPARRPARSP